VHVEEGADAGWVARLAQCSANRAERALREAAGETRLFRSIAREHAKEGRPSYVEIDAPLELYALTRLLRPRHVVEVGVSSGVSSAYVLAALAKNARGTLHSVDLPTFPKARGGKHGSSFGSWTLPAGRTSGWAVPFALRGRWDLRLGDKREVLPLLAEELPSVELFVYDVPHRDTESFGEFRTIDPLLRPGAVAIADHGPTGELCGALRRWARSRSAVPSGRAGLGLYGFACPRLPSGRRPVPARD
jgi:hypothetical protein